MANFTSILTGKQVESLLANYATCTTAGGTAAKVATISSINGAAPQFELFTGVTVRVKFTNSNTVANPTLNVNGTGAKSIVRYGTTAPSTTAATSWSAGAIISLTYDGTSWVMNDNNTGDLTGVTAGVGIAGGGTSGSVTVKAKLRSETALTVDSAAATTTSGKVYPVAVDKSGYLSVNVPWTDTNSTDFASTSHKHAYSGTTSASTSEVSVVTGVEANGTATALTGVKVSNSASAAPGGHTHSYTKATGITLAANESTATGRIAYVSSVSSTGASASGTAKAGSETHTHTYSKASLTGSNTTHTTKYMKFSAGTTPKSSATPNYTSTASGANTGTAVTAITGVEANGTATALTGVKVSNSASAAPGGHTHSYTPTGTIELASSEDGDSGYLKYAYSIGGGSYTLGGTKTFVTGVSGGSGSLTSYTTASGSTVQVSNGTRIPYIAGTLSDSTLTLNTYYLAHAHRAASSSGSGTVSLSGSSPYLVYRYIKPTFTGTSANTGVNNGTNFNAATAVSSNGTATVLTGVKATSTADVAPNNHTHSYDKTSSVTLTAGTAPSMNFNTGSSSDTPYIASMTNSSISISHTSTNTGAPSATTSFVTGVSGGTVTPSTRYLSAALDTTSANTGVNNGTNFNAATAVSSNGTATVLTGVKATGTASVSASEHTHAYSGTTGTPQ